MQVSEAVSLIEKGVNKTASQKWLDLGAGDGLFTIALADLIESPSEIIAIDLKPNRRLTSFSHPFHKVGFVQADFTETKNLPGQVDGVVMANSLHFVKEKKALLKEISSLLNSRGKLIIIEYDLQKANPWVPFPIRKEECITLLQSCGFSNVRLIGERQSSLNGSVIYCLDCLKD